MILVLVLIGHRKSQCIQSVYLPTWNEERRVFSAFVGSFPVSIEAVRFAKAFLLQVYHASRQSDAIYFAHVWAPDMFCCQGMSWSWQSHKFAKAESDLLLAGHSASYCCEAKTREETFTRAFALACPAEALSLLYMYVGGQLHPWILLESTWKQ